MLTADCGELGLGSFAAAVLDRAKMIQKEEVVWVYQLNFLLKIVVSI